MQICLYAFVCLYAFFYNKWWADEYEQVYALYTTLHIRHYMTVLRVVSIICCMYVGRVQHYLYLPAYRLVEA